MNVEGRSLDRNGTFITRRVGMTWADERNRGWRLNCRGDVKGGLLGDGVSAAALWGGGDERGREARE